MLVRLWFLLKIVALLTGDIEVMAFRGGCRLITFRNRGYRGLEILFERKGIIGEI
jgi:hypothetical protein